MSRFRQADCVAICADIIAVAADLAAHGPLPLFGTEYRPGHHLACRVRDELTLGLMSSAAASPQSRLT